MRRFFAFTFVALASCDHRPSGMVVEDANFARLPDGRISAAVDVTAASSTGSDIGQNCVSVHWFAPGVDLSFVYDAPSYSGALEWSVKCFPHMADGDTRRVVLESKSDKLADGTVVRVQAYAAGRFDTLDTTAP